MHTAQITNNLYAAWSDEYTRDNSSTVLLDLEQEVRTGLGCRSVRAGHALTCWTIHPPTELLLRLLQRHRPGSAAELHGGLPRGVGRVRGRARPDLGGRLGGRQDHRTRERFCAGTCTDTAFPPTPGFPPTPFPPRRFPHVVSNTHPEGFPRPSRGFPHAHREGFQRPPHPWCFQRPPHPWCFQRPPYPWCFPRPWCSRRPPHPWCSPAHPPCSDTSDTRGVRGVRGCRRWVSFLAGWPSDLRRPRSTTTACSRRRRSGSTNPGRRNPLGRPHPS